jgi:hypothetical protein
MVTAFYMCWEEVQHWCPVSDNQANVAYSTSATCSSHPAKGEIKIHPIN